MSPRALAAVLLLAVLTLAPNTTQAQEEGQYVDPQELIRVGRATDLTLRPDDGGWGRIVLRAEEDVSLHLAVTHDVLSLKTFARGDGYYDGPTNFTILHFFHAASGPSFQGTWLDWWNNGVQDWGPHRGMGLRQGTPLVLATGVDAILLLANNVTGYTIRITGDDPADAVTRAWTLRPHPDMHPLVPAVREETHLDGAVTARSRGWSATAAVPGAALFTVSEWAQYYEGGPYATAGTDETGWTSGADEPALGTTPLLEFDTPTGGTGGGWRSTRYVVLPDPDPEYTFYRLRTELEAGDRASDEGAQFFVLPYGPL